MQRPPSVRRRMHAPPRASACWPCRRCTCDCKARLITPWAVPLILSRACPVLQPRTSKVRARAERAVCCKESRCHAERVSCGMCAIGGAAAALGYCEHCSSCCIQLAGCTSGYEIMRACQLSQNIGLHPAAGRLPLDTRSYSQMRPDRPRPSALQAPQPAMRQTPL